MSRRFAVLLFASLLGCRRDAQESSKASAVSSERVVTSSASSAILPAPDGSLTLEEYVEKGVPASDRAWAATTYKLAADALSKLAAKDVALLPRWKSPRSGPLFARMTNRENLDLNDLPTQPRSKRILTVADYLEAVSTLLKTYLNAHAKRPSLGHELAALQALAMNAMARMVRLMEEDIATEPASGPGRARVEKGRAKVVSGMAGMLTGNLDSFSELENYDADDRLVLAASIASDGVVLLAGLPPLSQLEMCNRIRTTAKSEVVLDVRAALERALIGPCTKTP